MTNYYNPNCDRYIQRTNDSTSHRLKSAYWTTKQAVIKKLRRKQDENIVASDSDLDAKLELLKSVQLTCRDLDNVLARYQRTLCYLSQAENEMGRFLKQFSLEDKTQAGKIMSAVGKALSSSAQQRLTLLSPLDRVNQEVKTFRQRAISDTTNTVKIMEQGRTEYRGALLWMKNVSEELDPDTHKQLEKFRCVQAQVRKAKASFDRLKVDSMQKVDLLAASRCNMLSHVLVGYQNTLLTFLEKTSQLDNKFNQVELGDSAIMNSDDNNHGIHQTKLTEEEFGKRLDEIFLENNGNNFDFDSDQFKSADNQTSFGETEDNNDISGLINGSIEQVPADHRDLFTDLFLSDAKDDRFTEQLSGLDTRPFNFGNKDGFTNDSEAVFSDLNQPCQNEDFGPLQSVGSKDTFRTPILPSHLLEQEFQNLFNPDTSNSIVTQSVKSSLECANVNTSAFSNNNNQSEQQLKKGENTLGTVSNTPKSLSSQQPTNLDAWLNLFSDLGPIGNPDTISKKTGQVTDA
ncbi:islet cell autoantigen, putative [Schistosoma mansoni]|uniref:islet cell autoantigen, putative n=1 Tax=Schistosoma mansoni TaxID=6183 RepID=UPI0001A6328E|nr:islet cell autoantigen, putative [Schistosoma mansoni]|eukprot:XP_018647210.1 islet cell autoantigen, putative [Schistosoma mansoni]